MGQKKSDEGKEITAMLCVVRKNLETCRSWQKAGQKICMIRRFMRQT